MSETVNQILDETLDMNASPEENIEAAEEILSNFGYLEEDEN